MCRTVLFKTTFFCAASSLLLFCRQPANAQQTQQITPPATPKIIPAPLDATARGKSRFFVDDLAKIAKQTNVVFVAEAYPMVYRLPIDVVTVPDEISSAQLNDVIEKAANAYDYTAERRGNVFILKKRYTNIRDLPDVTVEECLAAMDDAKRVATPYNPDLKDNNDIRNSDSAVRDFVNALSTEQQLALQTGTLQVGSLDGPLRKSVQSIAQYFYVQSPLRNIDDTVRRLQKTSSVTLLMDSSLGSKMFCYGIPSVRGRILNIPFEQGPAPLPLDFSRPHQQQVDEANRPFVWADAPPTPERTTLGAAVAALNARLPVHDILSVDPILSSKTVTVVGDANPASGVTPQQMLSALAQVYGLRVAVDDKMNLRLARRGRRAAINLDALAQTINLTFPEPLWRAFSGPPVVPPPVPDKKSMEEYRNKTPAEQKAMRQKESFAHRDFMGQQMTMYLRPHLVRHEAAQRLRQAMELYQKAAKDDPPKPVPLPALSADERNLFAIALMADVMESVRFKWQETPPYIAHLDEDVLQGGFYTEKEDQSRRIELNFKNKDGSVPGPGVSNITVKPYPKIQPPNP